MSPPPSQGAQFPAHFTAEQRQIFYDAAQRWGVPVGQLINMALTESDFQEDKRGPPVAAQGGARAEGIMQWMPATRNEMINSWGYTPFNPDNMREAVDASAHFLRDIGTLRFQTERQGLPLMDFDPLRASVGYIQGQNWPELRNISVVAGNEFDWSRLGPYARAYARHLGTGDVYEIPRALQVGWDINDPGEQQRLLSQLNQQFGTEIFTSPDWARPVGGIGSDFRFPLADQPLPPERPGFESALPFLSERWTPSLQNWINNPTGGGTAGSRFYEAFSTSATPETIAGFDPRYPWHPEYGASGPHFINDLRASGQLTPEVWEEFYFPQGSLPTLDGTQVGPLYYQDLQRNNPGALSHLTLPPGAEGWETLPQWYTGEHNIGGLSNAYWGTPNFYGAPSSGQVGDWFGQTTSGTSGTSGYPWGTSGMGNQGMGNIADMTTYNQPTDYTSYYGALGNTGSVYQPNYNQTFGSFGNQGIDYQPYFQTAGLPSGGFDTLEPIPVGLGYEGSSGITTIDPGILNLGAAINQNAQDMINQGNQQAYNFNQQNQNFQQQNQGTQPAPFLPAGIYSVTNPLGIWGLS